MSGLARTGGDETCPVADLLPLLKAFGWHAALVVAGGGSGAVGECFRIPGASQVFVDAAIPYSRAAMLAYLNGRPPTAGSAAAATAVQLGRRALTRAKAWADQDSNCTTELYPSRRAGTRRFAGLACVAALPTNRTRQGRDRIHVVARTSESNCGWSAWLAPQTHTRTEAEALADAMIFGALGALVGQPFDRYVSPAEGVEIESFDLP